MTVPNSGGQAYSANGHDVASEMLWAARGPGHPGSHQEERDQAVRGERAAQGPSALRLVWIFPDLLSTYGDRGNLIMLARRARLRGLAVDQLRGFENHQGVTRLGRGVKPLARVILGVGNGDGTEGAYAGRVLGTYLHGPALVRNPGLADLLLTWAAGPLPPIADADEAWTRRLRAERLAAVAA